MIISKQEDNIKCRFCNKRLTKVFADLGESPLANSFLRQEQLCEKERFYPLKVFVCESCYLVQLQEFEAPKNIFSEYAYFSSYSNSWLDHCKRYTEKVVKRFDLNKDSQVIEIASNDGYLLQFFKEKKIPVLGIEPAVNVVKAASKKGIKTLVGFFDIKTAQKLRGQEIQADLLIANNVLAHVPNLNEFIQAMKIILKPNGVITAEFPHLLQLISLNQFDTIYHEHFSYFSLIVILKIFSENDLDIFDIDEISTHGGSLRVYAGHKDKNKRSARIDAMIKKESEFGLKDISIYTQFAENIMEAKKNIQDFFESVKDKKLVCYGAPAKGNTLLNFCNIGTKHIKFAVDLNPYKQGMFLPGTHIAIEDPRKIDVVKPDYVVIMPWNLKEEIMRQLSYIRKWDAKFVVLIPKVTIL